MGELISYERFLLTQGVKRTFEENYIRGLFESNKDIDQSFVVDFLHQAQLSGANPAQKQIYLVKYWNKGIGKKVGVVVFSYHFFLNQANQTGEVEGLEVETKLEKVYDPITREEREELVATAIVKRKGRGATTHKARWSEFYNPNSDQWKLRPYGMLEKCAIANVLRWAFPEALSGMFIEDEISEQNYEGVIKIDDPKAIDVAVQKADAAKKMAEEAPHVKETMALAQEVEQLLDQVQTFTVTEKTALLKKLFIRNIKELYTKSLEELTVDKDLLVEIINNQQESALKNSQMKAGQIERFTFSVTGNTASHKNALKSLGGKWNATTKSWDFSNVPADYHKEVKKLEGLNFIYPGSEESASAG
nr:hypothetical protein BHI3_07810 [Bacteriovorax sp. HI3]